MRRAACLLALVLLGCPPKTDEKAPSACTKVGDTCTVAAGKLGTCVAKDDCTGSACLVCQSQH